MRSSNSGVTAIDAGMIPVLKKILFVKLAVYLGLAANETVAAADGMVLLAAKNCIVRTFKRYFVPTQNEKSTYTLDGLQPTLDGISWCNRHLRDRLLTPLIEVSSCAFLPGNCLRCTLTVCQGVLST